MTEEQVTKLILNWLEETGWNIICFDFPQSGTGISLHPNEDVRTSKNKGDIIPDIVAIKEDIVVFFENKDHFALDDFLKVNELRYTNDYSESIVRLLQGVEYSNIFYGVGLPYTKKIEQKTNETIDKIDFAIFVTDEKNIVVYYQVVSIFP